MFAELAFAAALNVQSQDQSLSCRDLPTHDPRCTNSISHLVGQLPWAGGAFPQMPYPDAALRERISGEATVECAVSRVDGTISNCRVIHETPAGHGFGATVRRAVSRQKLDPNRWSEETVRVRVEFRV